MRHVIIYSWEEVKKVLENELEDDKYRVQVKPCLLKKGYGVVEIEEMDIMEGMIEDMQEQLRILKGFINQRLDKEVRDIKSTEDHIREAKQEADEAKERDFEAEKERIRRMIKDKERD